jgi:acetyltransferase
MVTHGFRHPTNAPAKNHNCNAKGNPIDIAGDAGPEQYTAALEILLKDQANDAILIMNVPTALASASAAAQAVVAAIQENRKHVFRPKPVFAVWIGEDAAAAAAFESAGIPQYTNESDAIRGFMHLVRYREAIDGLMEAPPSLPAEFSPDVTAARRIVQRVVNEGRTWLDPLEVTALLEAYSIPITPAVFAGDADEAATVATPWLAQGQAVVVKILSSDINHKSDVGGVRLNLTHEAGVREAVADILARAHMLRPQARIAGVTIHPMIFRPKARELIAGIADDSTFGPVVVFGCGGTAVEVINDKALALPPLDLKLAHELISRTRVSRILKAYRDVQAADENAIALVLVKLAHLVADVPEVRELDLNPLLADQNGLIAVDARASVAPIETASRGPRDHPRFAIRPYPKEWERHITLKDGTPVFVRPLRPDDEHLYGPFFEHVTDRDLRLRFFAPVKNFGHAFVARFTQIDYARAMAFVAVEEASGNMLGVVRLHANANYDIAEYAILVRSDLKGRGLGWLLMQMMIDYARSERLKTMEGQVLAENTTMLAMCKELGFVITPDPQDSHLCVVKLSVSPEGQIGTGLEGTRH